MADEVVLISSLCRYLTGRFGEAAAMAAEARAAGRDRHDPNVHLWGLLVVMESRLRVDPGDPTIAEWLEEADQLARQHAARIDAVRAQVAAARFHLAGGRPTQAWRATRTAVELGGPESSFAPYTLEAHAGIPEVCLALLEQGGPNGVDPAELRATAAAGLRRLRRYARTFPMARPSSWPGPDRPSKRSERQLKARARSACCCGALRWRTQRLSDISALGTAGRSSRSLASSRNFRDPPPGA